jgi:hypothetical protein
MTEPRSAERAGARVQVTVAVLGAAGLVALATWLVFGGHEVLAGAAAAGAGALLVASAVLARRRADGLLIFLDSVADVAYSGCLLSAIALTTREDDAPAAGAALGAMVATFLGSYVRARGQALGYPVEESIASRVVRYGLVSGGLVFRQKDAAMFALLALTVLITAVRTSQVVKKERE